MTTDVPWEAPEFSQDICKLSPEVAKVHEIIKRSPVLSRVSDDRLPYITAEEVTASGFQNSSIWLVIDNIIYDCSEFVKSHPGGRAIIEGFAGQDCSWQFWNFHCRDILQVHGHALRLGRTSGVVNRHKPPDKILKKKEHIGTSRLNIKDW